MLKKIREKRIEQFKTDFPEFKVSKKSGSLYIPIGETESVKKVKHTGRAVTKGSVKNLGKISEWKKKYTSAYRIT